jgi:ribosomal protein S18 acetylase RimI-like enzyme
MQVFVRECRQEDLVLLEQSLPTGRNHYHEARYRRQDDGFSTFLIACLDDVPAGIGEVIWHGFKEPGVPDCPEINGLEVVPERRSQGIGTAIIRAAEQLAVQRGRHQIGLGVNDDNLRAAALYCRLGYRETGCHYLDRYSYVDDDGMRHEIADPCRFLIKTINGVADRRTTP